LSNSRKAKLCINLELSCADASAKGENWSVDFASV